MKAILIISILATLIGCGSTQNSEYSSDSGDPEATRTKTSNRELLPGNIKVAADHLMQKLEKEQYDDAFAYLKTFTTILPQNIDQLKVTTVQQFKDKVIPNLGKPTGYALVKVERIAGFYWRLTYLQKLESNSIRWVMTFYKPKKDWLISNIKWDEKWNELFE